MLKRLLALAVCLMFVFTSALADVFVLPSSLKQIDDRAFYNDTSVTEIVIPEGTADIGAEAFAGSTVTKLTIPSTVTSIGRDAFSNSSLTEIVYNGSAAQWEALDLAGTGLPMGTRIFSADQDFVYGAENILDSGTCGTNVTWSLDENYVLTISGTGEMTDYDSQAPWVDAGYGSQILTAVVEEGITKIGESAFYKCTAMTAVYIPRSVISIGEYAFYQHKKNGCCSLATVYYAGSQEEYDKIEIAVTNSRLSKDYVYFEMNTAY